MERISRKLESSPGLSKRALREAVPGTDEYKDQALGFLVADGWAEVQQDGQAQRHYSLRPFREATAEADRGPVARP